MSTDRLSGAARLGYLPENGPLYPDMTPTGLLKFFGAARGLDRKTLAHRLEAVVAQCSLESVAHKPIGKLSKGYRQRVSMAQALLHDPEVLILDEPVNGLDPEGILWIRTLLRDLAAEGRTVFVSSHLMSEMALTADHVIVIGRGRLLEDAEMASMIERAGTSVVVRSPDAERLAAAEDGTGAPSSSASAFSSCSRVRCCWA